MNVTESQPDPCTDPYADYYVYSMRLVGASMFILRLATACDEFVQSINERADSHSPQTDANHYQAERESATDAKEMFKAYQKHLPIYLEANYCRGVDNFLSFVSQLLSLVFLTKPETLRSDQKISIADALVHTTMDDLVKHIAEETVHRLSYRGFGDLNDWAAKRLGFRFIEDDATVAMVVRILETRNLLVHNRGIVNREFIRRTQEQLEEGHGLNVTVHSISADLTLLDRQAIDIEKRAQVKFGLPTPVSFEAICSRLAEIDIVVKRTVE